MLGKLMKYEWKETWKAGVGVLFAMAAATLLGWLGMGGLLSDSDKMENLYAYGSETLEFGAAMMQMAGVFSILLFTMVLMFSVFFMLIYLIVRYYKTMFSDEGYLTHTLPVQKWEIFLSKVLVGGFWLIIVYIGLMASIFGFVILAAGTELGMAELLEGMKEIGRAFSQVLYGTALDDGLLMLGTILYMILSPFLVLVFAYGSFTIGQLCHGARVFMGFVVYFGIGVIQYILQIVMKASLVAGIRTDDAFSRYLYLNVFGRLILSVGLAVGIYLWSMHVLNKKLNLK